LKKSKKNDRNNKYIMIILGIETSCDDTGISILKASGKKTPDFEILANVISSQIEIHKKYGGVYPTMARREHEKNLTPVLKKALKKAGILKKSKIQIIPNCSKSNPKSKIQNHDLKLKTLGKIFEREPYLFKQSKLFLEKYEKPKIDAIAITIGPGLDPCLWTGVNFARALSYYWDIPIIPVNHIEAHILVNWLTPINEKSKIQTISNYSKSNPKSKIQNRKQIFPAICLVVSGGHTQLILMKGIGKYKILGETRDDAAGECFDKTARILGLEYPGGPAIAEQVEKFKVKSSKLKVKMPRPMIYSKDYDFSFSGLKTAVLYDFKKRSPKIQKDKTYIQAMCAEIQQSIIDVLIKKTLRATQEYKAKTIILGGGVCANEELRKQFMSDVKCQMSNVKFLAPPKILCTDNGLMTAIAGFYHHKPRTRINSVRGRQTKNWKNVKVNANLRIDDGTI
jgi:N6-L-threonylcarbamoyladenine synthase